MDDAPDRTPRILIASHGEWVGRSVESVLALEGYVVQRVGTGWQALEIARATQPDALILDSSLSDLGGIEVCRTLRDDPDFDRSTPIFITAPAPVSNRIRTSAYEAGGWDFCSQPLDVESLLLKLGTFLRGRRQTRGSTLDALVDPHTGVYTTHGLRQWAEQLGARAARNHESLACLAVSFTDDDDSVRGRSRQADMLAVADLCLAESRKSDVVAYVGENRFAILAPDTDGDGARGFAARLQRAVEDGTAKAHRPPRPLRAGFYAVTDFGAAGVPPVEVVQRAQAALSFALSRGGQVGFMNFDDLPVS